MGTAVATPRIVFHRFAWKEYRMLRGFWLAVFLLAMLEQLVSALMLNRGPIVPGWMFASAWGAAALYAVGAAVTLFGAENEERTREFLQTLPTQWLPMFLAKLALAVGSALLLAAGLCVAGWLVAGGAWPRAGDMHLALGVGSVAVLEATAWGLLFSLLWRQPLLAAIAALAAASIGAQLAIGVTPNIRNMFTVQSYHEAIPARLLLCLAVFALDVVVGRRWLQPRATGNLSLRKKTATRALPTSTIAVPSATRAPRRRMLARLLWQTWRESWQPLLAVVPLSVFLMVALQIPTGLVMHQNFQFDLPIPVRGALFLPALMGALVFRADQKKDHRLFLAAHAASPRLVWLARQLVWLGAMLLMAVVVQMAIAVVVGGIASEGLMRYLRGDYWGSGILIDGWHWDRQYHSDWSQAWDYQSTRKFLLRGAAVSWCALITAYALGQCCSMLLKREVLAGFLALIFSVALAAWAMVVMFWGLSPAWFVLPLGVGALLATWLRAPDWIVGKRRFRTWLLPGLVMVLPVVGALYALPAARLAQLDLPQPVYPFLAEPLETSLARRDETRTAGQETALEYERLSAKLASLLSWDELRIEGKTWDEWGLSELTDASIGTNAFGEEVGYGQASHGLGRSLSDAESAFLAEMSERFQGELNRKNAGIEQAIVERLLELSQRPHCRFPSDSSYLQRRFMQHFLQLLDSDGIKLTEAGELDAALARYCAWVRFQGHLRQGQPTWTRESYLSWSGHNGILAWARHEDQTSERIKQAIAQLQECFRQLPHPREAILADRQLVRDVLDEKEMPSFMLSDRKTTSRNLAYLANTLPWERQRALRALDLVTENRLNYVDAVVHAVGGETHDLFDRTSSKSPRELVRFAPWYGNFSISKAAFNGRWESFLLAGELLTQCQSSYLLSQELNQSGRFFHLLQGWVDAETRRRALVVQLALLAYRIDHEVYPKSLEELTPGYLPAAVLDPFSGEAFRYRAEGFELPIDRWHREGHRIPAGTPLLWSIGNANSQLRERLEEGQTVLKFVSTETVGHCWGNLVFSLPVLR